MTRGGHGILAVGSFVPRSRLPCRLAQAANGWFAPSLNPGSDARRSFCDWDEDALTMAVEAGRACGLAPHATAVAAVELASTSLPFADRSNAGVVREALDLPAAAVEDKGGSLRAASTALVRALTQHGNGTLLIGSDCVDAKPASAQEMRFGHGAGAVLVGTGEPIASVAGTVSVHQDFVDHYRSTGERFEYALEPRWARDAGYRQQVLASVEEALNASGRQARDVSALAISAPGGLAGAVYRGLARALGVPAASGRLESEIGFCGAAQPLLALIEALESAAAGDSILLVALGQGVDVLVLDVVCPPATASLKATMAVASEESNYTRYLALRGLLPLETGIRAERDKRTALSAFWREHETITAFKGGLCSACDTLQFPPARLCVSCGAADTQAPARLADRVGTVRSFTEDWLAYTPKPPLVFGNVGFGNGANVLMEFADVAPGQLKVGMPLAMRFRIKDVDERRRFRRYFWKPVPLGSHADA